MSLAQSLTLQGNGKSVRMANAAGVSSTEPRYTDGWDQANSIRCRSGFIRAFPERVHGRFDIGLHSCRFLSVKPDRLSGIFTRNGLPTRLIAVQGVKHSQGTCTARDSTLSAGICGKRAIA